MMFVRKTTLVLAFVADALAGTVWQDTPLGLKRNNDGANNTTANNSNGLAPDFSWGQRPMRGVNIGGW